MFFNCTSFLAAPCGVYGPWDSCGLPCARNHSAQRSEDWLRGQNNAESGRDDENSPQIQPAVAAFFAALGVRSRRALELVRHRSASSASEASRSAASASRSASAS